MNKVHLIGNLVKDVELRYTGNNTPIATYTIAINTKYGEKQDTDYINIKTWGKSGEFVSKYFKKGQPIAITGRLKNNNYEDNNGIKHYGMEVVTEDVEFVGARKESAKELTDQEILRNVVNKEKFQPSFELTDDDGLPF